MARFGMVGKLLAHPGRRGELVELLLAATRELQGADGCELYVVSQDRDDLDKIWVFEAWRDERRIAPRWTCQRSLPAFVVLRMLRMIGRGEAQRYRNMSAELPTLSTPRPVQNFVDNAKRRMAYGPVRRLSSGCPEADRLPGTWATGQ
jgi:hypothetical protein